MSEQNSSYVDMDDIEIDQAITRESLLGTKLGVSYAGVNSFMRRKYTKDLTGADIVVSGIPFDQSVTNRPGTRFGPEAVRRATGQHAWGPIWPWRFDPFDTLAVIDAGDCFHDWGDSHSIIQAIEDHADRILNSGAEMYTIGGDHFISYPLLKAHARKHGPLALLQFDAHRDVDKDDDDRIDHGSMFYRAIKDGIIDPQKSVQVGIRTMFADERSFGMTVIGADEVHSSKPEEIVARIEGVIGDHKTYMTFDIDCLDPAFAPGTGTPVPGGLSTYQALAMIRLLKNINIVGSDIVEVAPMYDSNEITSNAAAIIATEYFCLRAWQKGARGIPMIEG